MSISPKVSRIDLELYESVLKQVCSFFKIDYTLAHAQIEQESQFYPKARSWCGAEGIAQFMPSTWLWVYEACAKVAPVPIQNDAYDPISALWCYGYLMGVGIPAQLKKLGLPDNDVNRLVSYNAGVGRVKNEAWKSIKETSDYVAIILKKK